MRKPGFDSNYELERAYNALISGNTGAAIQLYQNVLQNDGNNKQALFGLAACMASAQGQSADMDRARLLLDSRLISRTRDLKLAIAQLIKHGVQF